MQTRRPQREGSGNLQHVLGLQQRPVVSMTVPLHKRLPHGP